MLRLPLRITLNSCWHLHTGVHRLATVLGLPQRFLVLLLLLLLSLCPEYCALLSLLRTQHGNARRHWAWLGSLDWQDRACPHTPMLVAPHIHRDLVEVHHAMSILRYSRRGSLGTMHAGRDMGWEQKANGRCKDGANMGWLPGISTIINTCAPGAPERLNLRPGGHTPQKPPPIRPCYLFVINAPSLPPFPVFTLCLHCRRILIALPQVVTGYFMPWSSRLELD
jgi:hypothetical protein